MKIKKGDTVFVLTGKDKGKKGEVIHSYPATGRVTVEGVNMKKKHVKAQQGATKGELIEFAASMNVSNVAIEDPKTKKPTRVGYKVVAGKNVRIAKKSGAELK